MAKNLFLHCGTDLGIEGLIPIEEACEILDIDKALYGCKDISDMLVGLIEELKVSVKEKNKLVGLLYSIFYDKYYPNEYKVVLAHKFKASSFYASLERAQLSNKIRRGNTFEIALRFILSAFDIMRACVRADIPYPTNDFFLALIHFSDDEIRVMDRDIVKQQNSIISAFASDYHSILFVDLDKDTVDVYQALGDNDTWIMDTAEYGFDYYRTKFAEKFICKEDIKWFLNQTTPQNIISMLKEDPVFYIDHRIISNGRQYPYQTKIVLDPFCSFGNRVLIGGHRIYDANTLPPDVAFSSKRVRNTG